MADIHLRFNKELLSISSPIECGLQRIGVNADDRTVELNILEPESVAAAYGPDLIAKTPCIVANTRDILPAKLEKLGLNDKLEDLAFSALDILSGKKIQHIFVELGATGLEFDSESRQSCMDLRDQYVESGRVFEKLNKDKCHSFDAYFLSGIRDINELKVALIGLRQVSDKPIFANVVLDEQGRVNDSEDVFDCAQIMSEFGAAVAGITTCCCLEIAVKLVKRMRAGCDLPIMVEFVCDNNHYKDASELKEAVNRCASAGAQFFRASGNTTPAHTAVLVGTTTYPEIG